jgi:hypothetical protein
MPAPNILPTNSIAYLIPLTPQNQELDVSLAGVTYHLRIKWNAAQQSWSLDIQDSQQEPILNGIPLVTGCDILEQYGYENIGGAMVVQSTTSPDTGPDFNSLGSTVNLFFIIPTATDA